MRQVRQRFPAKQHWRSSVVVKQSYVPNHFDIRQRGIVYTENGEGRGDFNCKHFEEVDSDPAELYGDWPGALVGWGKFFTVTVHKHVKWLISRSFSQMKIKTARIWFWWNISETHPLCLLYVKLFPRSETPLLIVRSVSRLKPPTTRRLRSSIGEALVFNGVLQRLYIDLTGRYPRYHSHSSFILSRSR